MGQTRKSAQSTMFWALRSPFPTPPLWTLALDARMPVRLLHHPFGVHVADLADWRQSGSQQVVDGWTYLQRPALRPQGAGTGIVAVERTPLGAIQRHLRLQLSPPRRQDEFRHQQRLLQAVHRSAWRHHLGQGGILQKQ